MKRSAIAALAAAALLTACGSDGPVTAEGLTSALQDAGTELPGDATAEGYLTSVQAVCAFDDTELRENAEATAGWVNDGYEEDAALPAALAYVCPDRAEEWQGYYAAALD